MYVWFSPLIVQILVFNGSPAGNHQPVRIVLCPRHVLDKPGSDHRPLHVSGAPLDKLRTVIGELPFMLVKVDGVAHDGTDRRRGNDVGIKPVLVQRLFLFECRPVRHIHRLADRPLDIVVIGWQIEEILMKELDMRLSTIVKLASNCARSAKNGMSPSRIYICSLSLVTRDIQHQRVNPQMTTQPLIVAMTVIMASLVFCSNDCISISVIV